MQRQWSPEAWARLGNRIRTERERRGLTRQQFADLAGVSIGTIRTAEGGTPPKGRWPTTFSKVEQTLGWAPDSMRAILDGGEPTPEDPANNAVPAAVGPGEVFVAWLRAARGRAGLSQAQVAAALNLDGFVAYQQTIAKIETGTRVDIPLTLAVALTRMFGTSIDAVLDGSAESEGTEAERAIRRDARRTALLQRIRDQIDAELDE